MTPGSRVVGEGVDGRLILDVVEGARWQRPRRDPFYQRPTTGPRPFNVEAVGLFNYRFGSLRRRTPPVIGG